MSRQIVFAQEAPLTPEARALIAALDELQIALYPAESNHLVPIEALDDPAVFFAGARVDGQLMGCGAVLNASEYGEIKRLYVSPEARGLGLALGIMEMLESHLVSLEIMTARLETGISQPEALGLYARLGYQRCDPFGDYAEDPLSVFMEKHLRLAS